MQMENSAAKDTFFRMLLECYGIWNWEYDAEMNLTATNSDSPYFHGMLLLGRDRKELILAHSRTQDVPLIISNSVGTMWAVVTQKDARGDVKRIFAVGPVLTGEFSRHTMSRMIDTLKLSAKDKLAVLDCMQHCPYIPTNVILHHAVSLHFFVTGHKIRISDFVYYTPRQGAARRESTENPGMPHAPMLSEKKLLDMVRTGNLEYHEALAEAGAVSPGIRARSADPIRQAKYSVVAFITLCARAAMEGGLSSEWAYTLSDTYTEAVDAASNVSQIAAVSHTMYEDYIRRVNQVRRQSGVSKAVRICRDYIDTHADQDLTLKQLAEQLGYTEYYLSRKFKAETGQSINTYLSLARLRLAQQLLSSTSLSVSEIADRLHFCSGSYFSEQFQKYVGMSPRKYREENNI